MKKFTRAQIWRIHEIIEPIMRIILWVIVLAPLVWLFLSFIDVNMHNSIGEGYGQYHAWNAFILFFDLMKGV